MNALDVNIIASSSTGNAIVISDGESTLLLDCGISYSKLQGSVDLTHIEAVLITHEHNDHCHAMGDLFLRGHHIISPRPVWDKKGLRSPLNQYAESERQTETRNWYIRPFAVDHDVECVGYLIESKSTGISVVYMVDGPTIDFDFTGVTHWIVEANYAHDLVNEGKYNDWLKERVKRSHMSIENLVKFLKSSDLSKTQGIWLVHMSRTNADEKRFVGQVQRAVGIPAYSESDIT